MTDKEYKDAIQLLNKTDLNKLWSLLKTDTLATDVSYQKWDKG